MFHDNSYSLQYSYKLNMRKCWEKILEDLAAFENGRDRELLHNGSRARSCAGFDVLSTSVKLLFALPNIKLYFYILNPCSNNGQ